MSRRKNAGTADPKRAAAATPRDRLGSVLKGVGAATAILTLVFGLHRLGEMVTGPSEQRREVSELLGSAQLLQEAADYAGAWTALDRAAALDARSGEIRRARETLAMAWLANVRVRAGEQSFTDIVEQLAPVLARGTTLERGPRRADLLAHLGWADFLRGRDGAGGQPDIYYRQSLEVDPDNVYAHAMLGHLILWRRGNIDEARTHFAAALRSGREREYVRQLQFAAYRNLPNEAGDLELVRLAVEMHAVGDTADATVRTEVFRRYEQLLRNPCYGGAADLPTAAARPGVSPDDQLAAFAWLFDHLEFPETNHARREYYRGCLLEAGGRSAEALNQYLLAQSLLPPSSSLEDAVRVAIQRLSRGAPR